MGAINNALAHQRVDFSAVSNASRSALENIASRYLPSGKREGSEWVALNPTRNDAKPGSFKFNLKTGAWSDFATGDKGGDAIDLVAYLERKSKLDAARDLAGMLGVKGSEGSTSTIGNIRQAQEQLKASSAASPGESRNPPKAFPERTPPDKDGKPRFVVADDRGPRIRDDEKRRHIYRKGDVPVRIKIMRKDDAYPFNVYRVTNEGVDGWQYAKPVGFLSVPYFTADDPFQADRSEPIYWPEGEKDVDTLTKAGLPAFSFGGTGDGLPSGCENYLAGRAVIIPSDNDEAGREHANKKAAAIVGMAASVRIVHFPETEEKGDISDWFAGGGTVDELKARIASAQEFQLEPTMSDALPTFNGTASPPDQVDPAQKDKRFELPSGYKFRDDGLYCSDPNDDEKPDLHISSSFDIVAETRDGDGASWGLLLHWVDHDGRDHRLALPRGMLAGDGSEARKMLLDGGMFIAPSQKARGLFNSFLLRVRSPIRARATQRIGWHGNAFVMPDDCFGAEENDSMLLQTSMAHEHAFRQSGTLQSWQEHVARYAVGNSRLVIALSAAFAGPLIGPCCAEGGGLHFRGASSIGKSTVLHIAGSAWGGGDVSGFVRSWRATANGLEGVALGHSDALLCLDELSQLAARDAGEAAYMLSNGSGKSRSSRDGSARKPAKWRVMFLSSGEIGLADKIAEDGRGRKLAAGQQVRIIDIPADANAGYGLFENLHDFASAEVFARHLRAATQAHYGVAAREYLKAIVPDIEGVRASVTSLMRAFSEQYVPAGADGQVERVAQRFALIAAGGEVAARANVLPWPPGEAIAAAGKCFDDWLASRGHSGASEVSDGIEQVRAFLLANGMARFIPAWEDNNDSRIAPRDVAGFRKKMNDGWDYFVTTTAWKEICSGADYRRLAATMEQKGFLEVESATRRARLVSVTGHGKIRLYHIPARFLEGDADA